MPTRDYLRGTSFPRLNNLTDITLDRRFSSICGYTEGDLDTVFAPELPGLDRERIREWYNRYDVLLLFDSREFAAHWFETGTPAFLVDLLLERRVASVALDRMVGTTELLSTFERRRHRHRGAAVPDRLPDDHGRSRAT